MSKLIHAESISFDHHEIKQIFEKTDAEKEFHIHQLVFYPYYYFEYKLERKSLFHPNGGVVGCKVDGINGTGAVVNMFPRFDSQEIQSDTMIKEKLKLGDEKITDKMYIYK